MKIAITVDGKDLKSLISEEFEKTKHLLIVETDDLSFMSYPNDLDHDSQGMIMAKEIIESNCEAVITGTIEEPAFELLATAQITRYLGTKHSGEEALKLMDAYKLDFIRDFKGGQGTSHKHHHHHNHCSCNCGEND